MKSPKTTVMTRGSKRDHDHDPIDVLMKEHEEGMKYVKRLDDAAEYIRSHGFSIEAFVQIADIIQFIDTKIRQHNEKEEKYLFPLLDRHVDASPDAMRAEHRELWRAFVSLKECIKDIEELRIYGTSVADLVQVSKTIVEALNGHFTKENEVLFPTAKRVLTDEEYTQLRENMAKAGTFLRL